MKFIFYFVIDSMESIDVYRESRRQKWLIFYAQICTFKAACTIKME